MVVAIVVLAVLVVALLVWAGLRDRRTRSRGHQPRSAQDMNAVRRQVRRDLRTARATRSTRQGYGWQESSRRRITGE